MEIPKSFLGYKRENGRAGTVKKKTSDAFISNQNENLKQLNNESNVTF